MNKGQGYFFFALITFLLISFISAAGNIGHADSVSIESRTQILK